MNIVLIGFKASGKTTLGRLLAELRGMSFVDTDLVLEERSQDELGRRLGPREVYRELGEERLRELEKDVLLDLALLDNQLISTGGGLPTTAANRKLLRMTGLCIFIDAPLSLLEQRLSTVRSPLFLAKSVAELHAERYPFYMETAHLRFPIRPSDTPDEAAFALNNFIEELDFGR